MAEGLIGGRWVRCSQASSFVESAFGQFTMTIAAVYDSHANQGALLAKLALPLPHKMDGTKIIRHFPRHSLMESEPFTHELELPIAVPHQLEARRWVMFAAQMSSNVPDQSYA